MPARFMPGSSNTQVATCSADRQVRMIDLDRNAAMPFVSHRSRVKALEVMSASCIISGGEGGEADIREADTRRRTMSSAYQTRE